MTLFPKVSFDPSAASIPSQFVILVYNALAPTVTKISFF